MCQGLTETPQTYRQSTLPAFKMQDLSFHYYGALSNPHYQKPLYTLHPKTLSAKQLLIIYPLKKCFITPPQSLEEQQPQVYPRPKTRRERSRKTSARTLVTFTTSHVFKIACGEHITSDIPYALPTP